MRTIKAIPILPVVGICRCSTKVSSALFVIRFKIHVDRGNLMIIVFSTTLGTSELQKKFLHVWFEGENTCSEYEEAESCVQEHKRRS